MEVDDTAAFGEPTIDVAQAVDIIWTFFCLVLVTLMQPGFACYEVGAISGSTSIRPILLKNIGDASVSLVAWLCIGYALASGEDAGGVVGRSFFGFTGDPFDGTQEQSAAMAFLTCLYQWSFAAACTTIISGAVADRIPFKTYLIYAFLTSAIFYPVLAHWVWANEGWASATRTDPIFGCGVLDFAGSGVVHMCGGGIGLIFAGIVGARGDRFFRSGHMDDKIRLDGHLKNHTDHRVLNEADYRSNDMGWMTLGCFLLWIGWYGFNCGSTLQISTVESQKTAGRAAMNTTIAAAFGCTFSMMVELVYHIWSPSYRQGEDIEDPLHKVSTESWQKGEKIGSTPQEDKIGDETLQDIKSKNGNDIVATIRGHREPPNANGKWWRFFTWRYSTHKNLHGAAVNGILAGLVGITAGCATMSYSSSVWVSFVSALLYHVSYRAIICLEIDDAVGAGAIHFVGGLWGLIAAGLTGTEAARVDAGYPSMDVCSWQSQTTANAVMASVIFVYAFICTGILWLVLKLLVEVVKRIVAGQPNTDGSEEQRDVLGLTEIFNAVPSEKAEEKGLADLRATVTRQHADFYAEIREMKEKFEDVEKQTNVRFRKRNTEKPEEVAKVPEDWD